MNTINPLASLPRLTRTEIALFVVTGIALLGILQLHLLPALIGGLLVFELVRSLAPFIRSRPIDSELAKVIVVALIAVLVVTVLSAAILGALSFFRSDAGNLSVLLSKLAQIIDDSRARLPSWLVSYVPDTAEELRLQLVERLRLHARDLQGFGANFARGIVHFLIGMIIGALMSLREARPNATHRPLASLMLERADRLSRSFRRVVFAQVWIAAFNAGLTGLYLAVVLPLMGVELPLTKTLIGVTFVCGLLPVIGNLVSNAIIVIVSLSHSLETAVGSLVYLVVIHKLEYFLNARIIGSRIHAKAWEMLIAMLVMEAAFGIAGLIAAPIYYAYVKDELAKRGLV